MTGMEIHVGVRTGRADAEREAEVEERGLLIHMCLLSSLEVSLDLFKFFFFSDDTR